ncbi:hypothetical protein AS4_11640 [Acinetobacter guillouiae]|nr:hypothetical protein AS4_11640 [Acinetobacter guillouiae]
MFTGDLIKDCVFKFICIFVVLKICFCIDFSHDLNIYAG